jgi:hypothetical protein
VRWERRIHKSVRFQAENHGKFRVLALKIRQNR